MGLFNLKFPKPGRNDREFVASVPSVRDRSDSESVVSSQFEEPTIFPQSMGSASARVQSSHPAVRAPIQRQVSRVDDDPERNIQVSRNIALVTGMLRDMYSLDLRIFGTESGRKEDKGERDTMIEQANLLFATIIGTLDSWEAKSHWWTENEMEVIRRIRFSADLHDPRRHRRHQP